MSEPSVLEAWERGDRYEQFMGRWSRAVAPEFLAWLNRAAGARWLDVGCGTGALSAAVGQCCAPALLAAVEPSAGFARAARQNLAGQAAVARASAAAIPFPAASFEVVISGLVLNFVPSVPEALREMARVTRRGGTVAAYVWDYAEKMEFLRYFWDAAALVDPGNDQLDEGSRFPICRPEVLQQQFEDAGLQSVAVRAIEIPTTFASFADYWQPFLGGQGSAPTYLKTLSPPVAERLRQHLQSRLPAQPDGSIHLIARAWAARGQVPGD